MTNSPMLWAALVVFSTGLAIAPMRSQAQNLNLKISEPSNSSISVQSSSSEGRVRTQGAVFNGSRGVSIQLQVGDPSVDSWFSTPVFPVSPEAVFSGSRTSFGGFSSSHRNFYEHQNNRWLAPQTHVSPYPHKVIIRTSTFGSVRPSRSDRSPVPH